MEKLTFKYEGEEGDIMYEIDLLEEDIERVVYAFKKIVQKAGFENNLIIEIEGKQNVEGYLNQLRLIETDWV